MATSSVTFTAVVKRSGVNPYVDLPAAAAKDFAGREDRAVLVRLANARAAKGPPGPPSVSNPERLVRINRLTQDGWFRTTVVPVRGGPYRLYLDTWMRASAGVAVGDSARIVFRFDRASRELPVPAELRRALSRDAAARKTWDSWPPSRRKEALSYLNFLESQAARERTVRKLLGVLRSG